MMMLMPPIEYLMEYQIHKSNKQNLNKWLNAQIIATKTVQTTDHHERDFEILLYLILFETQKG